MLIYGSGMHRFSVALILELEKIPAQIGIVDKNAIHMVSKYRA